MALFVRRLAFPFYRGTCCLQMCRPRPKITASVLTTWRLLSLISMSPIREIHPRLTGGAQDRQGMSFKGPVATENHQTLMKSYQEIH